MRSSMSGEIGEDRSRRHRSAMKERLGFDVTRKKDGMGQE
jgi:hypothetical protein